MPYTVPKRLEFRDSCRTGSITSLATFTLMFELIVKCRRLRRQDLAREHAPVCHDVDHTDVVNVRILKNGRSSVIRKLRSNALWLI